MEVVRDGHFAAVLRDYLGGEVNGATMEWRGDMVRRRTKELPLSFSRRDGELMKREERGEPEALAGLDVEDPALELDFNVSIIDGREVHVSLPPTALVMELASRVGTELDLAPDCFVKLVSADDAMNPFSFVAAWPRKLVGLVQEGNHAAAVITSIVYEHSEVIDAYECARYADGLQVLLARRAQAEVGRSDEEYCDATTKSAPETTEACLVEDRRELVNALQSAFEEIPHPAVPGSGDAIRRENLVVLIGHVFDGGHLAPRVIGNIMCDLIGASMRYAVPEDHAVHCTCELLLIVAKRLRTTNSGKNLLRRFVKRLDALKYVQRDGEYAFKSETITEIMLVIVCLVKQEHGR